MRCISIATLSNKRQVRPPKDHFKRLLNEACPKHAYPIRHKLKDLRIPHLGSRARRRAGQERYDAVPRGKYHHDSLRGVSPHLGGGAPRI
jgi:hypothetical protein